MIGHPPAVIQPAGPAVFQNVRSHKRGETPQFFICGKPVEEGVFYRALAEWLRRGKRDRCLKVLNDAV